MTSKEDEEHQEHTIAEESVVTKYQAAADVCGRALKAVINLCISGASVIEICKSGDTALETESTKVFRKDKNIKKGVAFPTCVAVNHCIGHYSPLDGDTDTVLADGDIVKIDMGAHVDGFIAVTAHTLVIGASQQNPVTGRRADVVLAAHYAFETALRMLRPQQSNYDVTDVVTRTAAQFDCRPIEGMLSHQLSQHMIAGDKTIIQHPNEAQRKEHDQCDFEQHEVYALDVLVSTGDGTVRELDTRTTIFRKTDEVYSLKLKASRDFFSQVSRNCGPMPFNLRCVAQDLRRARLGVVECVNHKLIEPFQVLYEKSDQFVAQFKATVLLTAGGTKKITGLPFDPLLFRSEHSVKDAELLALLDTPIDKRSAAKKKKKEAAAAASSAGAEVKSVPPSAVPVLTA